MSVKLILILFFSEKKVTMTQNCYKLEKVLQILVCFKMMMTVVMASTGDCFVELKNKTFPFVDTVGESFENITLVECLDKCVDKLKCISFTHEVC